MKHPFRKKMPLRLDIQIRIRLLFAYLGKHRHVWSAFGAGLLVPVMATYLFFVSPGEVSDTIDQDAVVQAIYTAQAAEIEKSETGIYHIKRVISEGSDKPAFVAATLGTPAPAVPRRVDEVETWQHNETALAMIESNGSERSFEAYLTREHNGSLGLHHFGPKDQDVDTDRLPYDQAHDLASLYSSYTSLETPPMPVLPAEADVIAVTESDIQFSYRPAAGLMVVAVVDLNSKLITEEIIYVVNEAGDEYEMTTVRYTERSVLPADAFEEIFDATQFDYTQIS